MPIRLVAENEDRYIDLLYEPIPKMMVARLR